MKFLYGRWDWTTRERGEENCYLLTNGLGGFSCSTMIGSSARGDHSFFMACLEAPNHRYSMVHRLEELLERDGREQHLSSQKYADSRMDEEGHRFLDSFCFEDFPQWLYHADGVEVAKEIAMVQDENTVAVRYQVQNRTESEVCLSVLPHLQFCPKGRQPGEGQEFTLEGCKAASNGLELSFETDGDVCPLPARRVSGLYYAYDARDGREPLGSTYINHCVRKRVEAGGCASLAIVYHAQRAPMQESEGGKADTGSRRGLEAYVDEIFENAVRYRELLAKTSGFRSGAARMLAKSAGQFVARRLSTGGMTLLAGYPFFEDWGRDTMIAVAGCCIATGQYETARSIFRTFAACCKEGLMPNLFPEGGDEPLYNTVDASLLFIHAVYLYYQKTGDRAFVSEMWRTMREIIRWYRRGTWYGIRADEDGLLLAGRGLDQVTWMDVRIGELLPTPRHGKPVEVNAYWYNALCVMEAFARLLGKPEEYGSLAALAGASFREKFWNEKESCLKDLLSGTAADTQIRCNQIWAVSMPFCALDGAQQKKVVDTVFEKLYTPLGLRTLAKDDPEFRGTYGGTQRERDLAYHQGTVWVFPLGAYYLAYLKTRRYSHAALETVRRQLAALEGALREGCIGQLSEIYDGEFPAFSRGCFAQAWSVGEILRVYEVLEQYSGAADGTLQFTLPLSSR